MLEFPEHAKSKLPDHQDARKPEQNVARSYIKGWALERPPLAEATWHHAVSRVATLIWEDAETQAMHPLPRLLAHALAEVADWCSGGTHFQIVVFWGH